MAPLITVIVPAHNTALWLDACVESVLVQSLNDFELILVNDGSTDHTGRLCDAWAERDTRVRVIHAIQGGVSAARNRGLAAARGEYIAFIDSDDWVHPELLAVLLAGVDVDVDWSVCSLQRVDKAGNTTAEFPLGASGAFDSMALPETVVEHALQSYWIFQPVCKLYRRQIIQTHSLSFDPELSFGEDLAFNLAYLAHVHRIRLIDRPLYYYRIMPTGLASSFNSRKANSFTVTNKMLLEFLRSRGLLAEQIELIASKIIINNYAHLTLQLVQSTHIPRRTRKNYFETMRDSETLKSCMRSRSKIALTRPIRLALSLNLFMAWEAYSIIFRLYKGRPA